MRARIMVRAASVRKAWVSHLHVISPGVSLTSMSGKKKKQRRGLGEEQELGNGRGST